jgi:hypothetical protein
MGECGGGRLLLLGWEKDQDQDSREERWPVEKDFYCLVFAAFYCGDDKGGVL